MSQQQPYGGHATGGDNRQHDASANNQYTSRGRGGGGYGNRGGNASGRGRSTPYEPPNEQQQRYLNARNTLRSALEEVDLDTGRSMLVRQPRVEGQPAPRGRGGGTNQQPLQNGIPAAHMTPHAASQPQLAQHGATVVRSSVTSVPQGAVHFFSSVQKRGGAFTTSERETFDQLRRSGAISKDRGLRTVASKYAGSVKTGDLERRFARMEARRAEDDFAAVARKRHRFELSDSESPSSSSESGSDTETEETPAQDQANTHTIAAPAGSSSVPEVEE